VNFYKLVRRFLPKYGNNVRDKLWKVMESDEVKKVVAHLPDVCPTQLVSDTLKFPTLSTPPSDP